jgi:flagellar motility protein MotE (MotC chaperone)
MIRILPLVIILLVMLVGYKVLDAINILPDVFVTKPSVANEEAPAKAEGDHEAQPEGETKGESKNMSKEADAHAASEHGDKKDDKPAPQPSKERPENTYQGVPYSEAEIGLLKELAKRRDTLNSRENDISLKENTLNVLEKSIEGKMQNLQQIQDQMKGIIAQYEKKEDEKIATLVKVYEAMKPQDAAKIFDQLEMPILIEVSVHMKEAKFAQILAKMEPKKAKDLTMEIANRRKVKE